MHEMQTIVTDVRDVCPSVCLSRASTRRCVQCVRCIRCSLCQITLASCSPVCGLGCMQNLHISVADCEVVVEPPCQLNVPPSRSSSDLDLQLVSIQEEPNQTRPRISANNFKTAARIFTIFGRKQGNLIINMTT